MLWGFRQETCEWSLCNVRGNLNEMKTLITWYLRARKSSVSPTCPGPEVEHFKPLPGKEEAVLPPLPLSQSLPLEISGIQGKGEMPQELVSSFMCPSFLPLRSALQNPR